MKQYTKEFVEGFYKQNDCELLEQYTNAARSLKYRCKCGMIAQNSFCNFIKNSYCWNCAARKQSFSQEYVETCFKDRDCELLDVYVNNRTRLKFRCKCGEFSTITFASFHNKGCYCEVCGGKKKLTIEYLKLKYVEIGCELLEENYKNARTKMKTKCSCGNIFQISWNNFQKGKKCKECGRRKLAEFFKLSHEQVKQFFENNRCKLLTNFYVNAQQKLDYICKCGRQSQITYNNFQRGRRCMQCKLDNIRAKFGDPKFMQRCRAMLRRILKELNMVKKDETHKLLGYSGKQLQEHITSHPNWDTVKDKIWHIDHIFPVKAFCDYNLLDIKLINCIDNLQPLTGEDNLKKNAKYSKEEFEVWLKSKNISV
jgi:hypothetical protein